MTSKSGSGSGSEPTRSVFPVFPVLSVLPVLFSAMVRPVTVIWLPCSSPPPSSSASTAGRPPA